jgi:predicted nucleotide-binding protein
VKLHGAAEQPTTGAGVHVDDDETAKGTEILPEIPAPLVTPPATPKEQAVQSVPQTRTQLAAAIADDFRRRRVFITHGKNRELVDPIKKLLEFGELEPVVSVERSSVSKAVPERVMDDMRGCGAAIIHVDAEETITDKDGDEHTLLNPNVLIEIGAAMAFYGRRFILLVREGIRVPSNLQGLYEVRYTGDNLDAGSTIKLLHAIKDIKNYALPTESEQTEG